MTLKEIQEVETLEQLESLIGNVLYDIGHRGGHVGFNSSDVAEALSVPLHYLPGNFGAHCNYLGGGIRGSIDLSTFNDRIPKTKAKRLTALAEACKRVYQSLEDEAGMNDTEDEDGETNWDALATQGARDSGISSAY